MNYNRYVICRSMDGLGGRDLLCPVHQGKGSPLCDLVVVAPVEELKSLKAEREGKDQEIKRLKQRVRDLRRMLA